MRKQNKIQNNTFSVISSKSELGLHIKNDPAVKKQCIMINIPIIFRLVQYGLTKSLRRQEYNRKREIEGEKNVIETTRYLDAHETVRILAAN